jgi:hypothetical protein
MTAEAKSDTPPESGWLPVVLACLAVFFTLAALVGRVDAVDDLDVERALDWLVIGPLWGAVAYFQTRQRMEGHKRGRIAAICAALVIWPVISVASQWWTDSQGEARLEGPRKECPDRMSLIVLRLTSYASSHQGFLPPAYQSDAEGRPMHSWRALIAADQLNLVKYHWDEPWNGPVNSRVEEVEPALFRCVAHKGETDFVAVVGPKTAFPGSKPAKLSQLSPRAILFVAVKNSGIKWLEPRDLTVDEAIRGLRGYGWMKITHVAFADGDVQPISAITDLDGLDQQLRAADVAPVQSP